MDGKQLLITPEEAQIIDASFKDGATAVEHKDFLLRVGACIVTERERVIDVDEPLLWALRGRVHPDDNVGGVDGVFGIILLKKVYDALLKRHPEVSVSEIVMPEPESSLGKELLVVEEESGRTTEDNPNEGSTENGT
jgi:hypothetical protein